jgi:hypothetical protein
MDWFDRERLNAGLMPRGRAAKPPGCRGLVVTFLIVVGIFLIVAFASGWVHVTKVRP